MLKKLSIALLCLTSFQVYATTTCPSVAELKNHQLNGWVAYNSDSGEELPLSQIKIFEKETSQFLMAEWAEGAPEGTSHCYYSDKRGEYMNAFLAQHDHYPNLQTGNWRNESGFLRCHADTKQCTFIDKPEEDRK